MNYANRIMHSDIIPYEVVRKVSDKTLEIRAMDHTIDPSFTPIQIPGGYAGHTVNSHDQKWIITSNEENRIIRIRLGKRGWKCANGNIYQLSDKPVYFYDYNY